MIVIVYSILCEYIRDDEYFMMASSSSLVLGLV
jgi:hypothetical protein